jgi:hypothetical protein
VSFNSKSGIKRGNSPSASFPYANPSTGRFLKVPQPGDSSGRLHTAIVESVPQIN